MATEQSKAIEALQMAIKMEIDGKEYYIKASQKSGNELGKKLLASLADEEDVHHIKFTEIYDSIRSKNTWPKTEYKPDGGRALRTVFAIASQKLGREISALPSELDAVQDAMSMENKTYDFYQGQTKKAAFAGERDFYQAVAVQEKEHHLVLLDYYEYLKDPAAWFVKKEHPSLDGG